MTSQTKYFTFILYSMNNVFLCLLYPLEHSWIVSFNNTKSSFNCCVSVAWNVKGFRYILQALTWKPGREYIFQVSVACKTMIKLDRVCFAFTELIVTHFSSTQANATTEAKTGELDVGIHAYHASSAYRSISFHRQPNRSTIPPPKAADSSNLCVS